jgi:hypothetical protein
MYLQARKYVPENVPLVNFFGYTLGGFYLARYSNSPAGSFDELVALAGLAWNFPTSCAWAARVYVNNVSARNHGVSAVGLPSRLASFRAVPKPSTSRPSPKNWWSSNGSDGKLKDPTSSHCIEIRNKERGRKGLKDPICTIEVPEDYNHHQWGPKIQMHLPSYSGATDTCPDLLKYSLRMFTKVRFISPLKIHIPNANGDNPSSSSSLEALGTVLGGKPLVCMSFDNMNIHVDKPETLHI